MATELLGTAISSTGDPRDSPFIQRWKDALRENPQVYFPSFRLIAQALAP